jgi:hypothetical protein
VGTKRHQQQQRHSSKAFLYTTLGVAHNELTMFNNSVVHTVYTQGSNLDLLTASYQAARQTFIRLISSCAHFDFFVSFKRLHRAANRALFTRDITARPKHS